MSSQIDILFPDLLGLAHGKTVPEARRDHPTHYAITVMVQGLDLEFLETANYSTSAGFPDMEAVYEDGTLRPWGARRVGLANLHFADGRPLPLDSRRALRAVMDRWGQRGLTPMSGYEMEFFLLAGRQPQIGKQRRGDLALYRADDARQSPGDHADQQTIGGFQGRPDPTVTKET